MIKSNTKKVTEKIKNYIVSHFADTIGDYIDDGGKPFCKSCDGISTDTSNYASVCNSILIIFKSEYYNGYNRRQNAQNAFCEWLQGLPHIVNAMYYYNVSAVDLLADWLEESDDEKSRYTDADAARMISYLLYREISKHGNINIIL